MDIDGRITILVSEERTTIEIEDRTSNSVLCKIKLTPEQFCSALGRCAYIKPESCKVYNLDKIGKKHENEKFCFEIPHSVYDHRKYIDEIYEIGTKALKEEKAEEWEMDKYFNSQDSFFSKDGKDYARAIIRRWVIK